MRDGERRTKWYSGCMWRGKGERFKDGKSKKYQGTLWRPGFGEIVVNETEVSTSLGRFGIPG